MSYVIRKKQFEPAPDGVHAAVCVDVVDLGVVATNFGTKEQVRLVWELDPTTAGTLDDGRRFIVMKKYTPSLHEKASLSKDLKTWRGRAFTPEELEGFDLESVIGAPCKLVITHNEKDGTIYANITAIVKADKNHKLLPTGDYIRVKDRPDHPNGNGGSHVPATTDEAEDIPF